MNNEYRKIHQWIRDNYGHANKCENSKCERKSNYFTWALLKGKSYDYKVENYQMLCKSCHTKYDFTVEGNLRGARKRVGLKRSEKTKNLMSLVAKRNNRRPPPKTKEQLEASRKMMLGNSYRKGSVSCWKGKHPEHMQGKNHPMYGKKGTNSPKWSSVKVLCDNCKKIIWKQPARIREYKTHFCNAVCRAKYGTKKLRKARTE